MKNHKLVTYITFIILVLGIVFVLVGCSDNRPYTQKLNDSDWAKISQHIETGKKR